MSIDITQAFVLIASARKMKKTAEEHFPQSQLVEMANNFREEVLQTVSDNLHGTLDFPVVEKTGIAVIKALCAPNFGYSLSRSFLPPMFTRAMMESIDRDALLEFIEKRTDGKSDPEIWENLYKDSQLNMGGKNEPLKLSNDIQRQCAHYFWAILGDSFVTVSPYDENAHLKAKRFYHAEPYIVTPRIEAEPFLVYTRGPKHSRLFAYMLHPELFPEIKSLKQAMLDIKVESPLHRDCLPAQQHFYPYKETRKEILEAAGIIRGRPFYPAASGFEKEIFGDDDTRTHMVEILWGDGSLTTGHYSWEPEMVVPQEISAHTVPVPTRRYKPRINTVINGTSMTITDMSGLKIRSKDS